MKRLNKQNINTPELFNGKFKGEFGMSDLERFEKLAKYFKGGTYVDVGCFDSPMPVMLKKRFPKSKIFALDFADQVIDYLSKSYPEVDYKLIKDCCELPFKDNSVEYIVAGEIIEHLEDHKKFIDECFRILAKGGWLAISTPHVEIEKSNRIGGREHIWSFDEGDLKTLLNNPEVETLEEQNNLTWLAWKQKER